MLTADGATQGASSQARRAASADAGAAHCARVVAHRAWRVGPGGEARRPGTDPSRQRRQTTGTEDGQ